jgi:alanine racemase
MTEPARTTWVEISRGALQKNFAAVKRHAGTAVCAVVKANAYGAGLVETASIFHRAGARMLAVTRMEEARELRDAGVAADILILAPPPRPLLAEAFGMNCAVAIADGSDVDTYAEAARAAGRPGRVHLKVDIGMGRLGVRPEHALGVASRIVAAEDLALEGVWTHFPDAAGESGRRHLERFLSVRGALGRYAPRAILHAANSAATLALPASRLDMVRVGTLLYGQHPVDAQAPFPLAETFAWHATVVSVRDLPAGATVGYGSEWRAKQPTRVATIPIGYVDGFGLDPSARSESIVEAAKAGGRIAAVALKRRETRRFVWLGSEVAPVVGRVAMQETTVSLEGLKGVGVGSVARIPVRRLLVGSHIERVYLP